VYYAVVAGELEGSGVCEAMMLPQRGKVQRTIVLASRPRALAATSSSSSQVHDVRCTAVNVKTIDVLWSDRKYILNHKDVCASYTDAWCACRNALLPMLTAVVVLCWNTFMIYVRWLECATAG
jgi:hypothetical protein